MLPRRRTHNGKPGKEHVKGLVGKLDQQHEFPAEAVVASADLIEMREGIYRGEEAPVQPSSSLQDELGHAVRNIGLSRRRLNVSQYPSTIPLGDELEAENSVLGQVHVGREDAGAGSVQVLASKILLQRPLAGLVVLQRTHPARRR